MPEVLTIRKQIDLERKIERRRQDIVMYDHFAWRCQRDIDAGRKGFGKRLAEHRQRIATLQKERNDLRRTLREGGGRSLP